MKLNKLYYNNVLRGILLEIIMQHQIILILNPFHVTVI